MNSIKLHIPNYVDHDSEDLTVVEFENHTQLVQIDFVKRWIQKPKFLRLSQDPSTSTKSNYRGPMAAMYAYPLLMAEMVDGTFWVIGRMQQPVPGIPQWSMEECEKRKLEYTE